MKILYGTNMHIDNFLEIFNNQPSIAHDPEEN
jgi:hypothetical protein